MNLNPDNKIVSSNATYYRKKFSFKTFVLNIWLSVATIVGSGLLINIIIQHSFKLSQIIAGSILAFVFFIMGSYIVFNLKEE